VDGQIYTIEREMNELIAGKVLPPDARKLYTEYETLMQAMAEVLAGIEVYPNQYNHPRSAVYERVAEIFSEIKTLYNNYSSFVYLLTSVIYEIIPRLFIGRYLS
jgi:hypothetical protein